MIEAIPNELIDDIVIEYDIKNDCLMMSKQYELYFDSTNPIYNFSEYVAGHQVFDEESQIKLTEMLENFKEEINDVQLTIRIINKAKKYEKFQLKGKLLKTEKKVIGVAKSLRIIEQAYIDPLTKIFNRNGLEEKMQPFLESCSSKNKIAFLIIDLDNFKQINDNLGHLLGDALLNEAAIILKENFPTNSIVSRIGGDEFVVFLHHINGEHEIEKLAKMLCKKIEQRYLKEEENFGLSVSVGIAFAKKKIRYEKLYVQADTALYQAKYNGKNQASIYHSNKSLDNKPILMKQENKMLDTTIRQFRVNDEQKRYRQMKTVLCEIIDILNNIEDSKTALNKIVKLIGEVMNVTKTYVAFYVQDGSCIGESYYYSKESKQELSAHLPLAREEYIKNFDEDGIFFCINVKEVNEPLRTELVRMKVDTMLQVLIKKNDKVIGILGVNSSKKKRLWNQKEIDLIYTVGKLITNRVYQMQKKIEENER